ncbi:hypothetical protein [Methylogaea oryzae]|uniref:Uncharacterized protein n=1 Tax=Methylogaea oryzae TaxID=1295382 RepID=A0A8D4VNX1_9GAMM|nr:hypothetical protein [Methylogaea oryzae]BBL71360.1 hypothetical protein MoryE10_19660 [Methylogaea oryzae]
MEPLTANRRKIGGILLAVALAAAAAALLYRQLSVAPLGQLARPGLPVLDLTVKEPEEGAAKSEEAGEAAPKEERCAELLGGDTGDATSLSDQEKRPADCPKAATWYVKRRPIALTLYFQDGKAFLDAYEHSPQWQAIFASRFVQGLFYEPLHSASVRAEDLRLTGLEGQFLQRLVTEAITARAQLHYDISHGKKGFVLSFLRAESPFAIKALPAITGLLARSGYRVPKLPEPVLEMRVGLQRLFLTEYQERIYLANGLEALLNVIQNLTPPSAGLPDAPVALTLRAEAFVDRILPVVVGKPVWDITASFDLKEGRLGALTFPAGRYAQALHPALFQGVLASIPHDAFAAVAASFRLPPGMAEDDWRRLATQGPAAATAEPKESGVALVWELDAQGEQLGDVGFAVASQDNPDAAAQFGAYLADSGVSAVCAGGTVFLAATSDALLTRMKESCSSQSLSVLDWERGGLKPTFASAQLALFVNPGVGLRELFLAGGAGGDDLGDFEPQWKQQYEQAKAAMREDSEKLFRQLPVLFYAGSVSPGADIVTLPGHAVAQGVSP